MEWTEKCMRALRQEGWRTVELRLRLTPNTGQWWAYLWAEKNGDEERFNETVAYDTPAEALAELEENCRE